MHVLIIDQMASGCKQGNRTGAIQSDAAIDRGSTNCIGDTQRRGAAPEIRVPFRVDSHHISKLGRKSQGGRRDRNQPSRESPHRECITLDRTRSASAIVINRRTSSHEKLAMPCNQLPGLRNRSETICSNSRLHAPARSRLIPLRSAWLTSFTLN